MKQRIELLIEQEELHVIIKRHFKIPEETEMESNTNAGVTTFTYKLDGE